ncbi:hypothetical protein KHQ81_02830 [Mycoplasmatota bacterium]|nr:hypothetical protein KHQ81_02830 [Mycoplasmatota bacterium]
MLKEICNIINLTDDENQRIISPKKIYNENYLLSLIMYWFSNNNQLIVNSDSDRKICKAFQYIDDAKYYTNATIETPFKVRVKGEKDPLAENSSTVSGVVGHFKVIYGKKKERLVLLPDASQFIVLEATMIKPLKKETKNFKKYHQIARDIGCMIQTLSHLENKFLEHLGLYVIAPEKTLKIDSFKTYTYKQNIESLIEERVSPYGEDEIKIKFLEVFKKLFQRIDMDCISFEDIIRFIKKNDGEFGEKLVDFYNHCLKYHGLK